LIAHDIFSDSVVVADRNLSPSTKPGNVGDPPKKIISEKIFQPGSVEELMHPNALVRVM
jgi:hypothetical protein